jgi:hypothetical protein
MSALGRKKTLSIRSEGVFRSLRLLGWKAIRQSDENANWRFYASRVRPRVKASNNRQKKLD